MANNALYYGDNLEIMRALLKERGAFIDLIYIDPPFNSKRNYNILFKDREQDENAQVEAFKDTWSNVYYQDNIEEIKSLGLRAVNNYLGFISETMPPAYVSYLSMMAVRIHYMRELLKDSGGFYLHCDPTMSHYLKIVCDLIFGADNFRNEIIWGYKTGGTPIARGGFARKHDVILFYAKATAQVAFNQLTQISYVPTLPEPHTDSGKKLGIERDELGKYRKVQMRDWWVDTSLIPSDDVVALYRNNRERLGYPTQKPLSLLKRIIAASSKKGDVVADFFCGCGTTIDAAIELKRNYIGADILPVSVALTQKRIKDAHGHAKNSHYSLRGSPREFDWRQELSPSRQKFNALWKRPQRSTRLRASKLTIGGRVAL